MHREYYRWHSPRLQRDMELLVFGYAVNFAFRHPEQVGQLAALRRLDIILTAGQTDPLRPAHYFEWAVEHMADLAVGIARQPRPQLAELRWSKLF